MEKLTQDEESPNEEQQQRLVVVEPLQVIFHGGKTSGCSDCGGGSRGEEQPEGNSGTETVEGKKIHDDTLSLRGSSLTH